MKEDSAIIARWWAALLSPDRAGRIILRSTPIDGFDLAIVAFVCVMYCGYGVSMGIPRGIFAGVVSGFKLPFLYLLTLAVCFPPFYVLNNALGPRVRPVACLRLLLFATSANAVAIVSYAPVSYFFTFTTSSSAMSGYRFLVGMHVVVFAIAGILSVLVIHVLFRATASQLERPMRPMFLFVFGGVYAFVGTQMSWVLRPWIGSWAIDYQPFRAIEGSFIESIFRLVSI
ncbi:MAG TPA: hypothetical protein PLJ47_07650 [Candidatus Hydrogenedentes bacterium]|nr:hypothetical protein [Candidatus Hydrogenedentota bacterium]HRK34456.1 hypothetical protein [Candidatus Hydrogenedentota bacterium]